MSSIQKTLIQKQMDELIQSFISGKQNAQTSAGWIQSARLALGMSLRQLAERVGVSVSALTNFEKREQADSVSLATLKKAANAMDMKLVYGFVSKHESLEQMIEKRAKEYFETINEELSIVAESELQAMLPIKWDIPFFCLKKHIEKYTLSDIREAETLQKEISFKSLIVNDEVNVQISRER